MSERLFGYALTIWIELKGDYFGRTGRNLAEEDLGSVLAFAYSYTLTSTEFRPQLRKSMDEVIWDRLSDYDDADFGKASASMLDQLDAFHEEVFSAKPTVLEPSERGGGEQSTESDAHEE